MTGQGAGFGAEAFPHGIVSRFPLNPLNTTVVGFGLQVSVVCQQTSCYERGIGVTIGKYWHPEAPLCRTGSDAFSPQ